MTLTAPAAPFEVNIEPVEVEPVVPVNESVSGPYEVVGPTPKAGLWETTTPNRFQKSWTVVYVKAVEARGSQMDVARARYAALLAAEPIDDFPTDSEALVLVLDESEERIAEAERALR